MSDPVTNVEIEDVLSSIRRLVAEGDKPKPDVQDDPVAEDRLVLSPADRIPEPDQIETTESSLEPEPEEPVSGAAEPSEQSTSADEVADSQSDLEEQPSPQDDAEPQDEADTSKVLQLKNRVDDAAPSQRKVTAFRARLEDTIAELEAAVTAQPDDWEPDGSEINSVPSWSSVGARPDTADVAGVTEDEQSKTGPDDTTPKEAPAEAKLPPLRLHPSLPPEELDRVELEEEPDTATGVPFFAPKRDKTEASENSVAVNDDLAERIAAVAAARLAKSEPPQSSAADIVEPDVTAATEGIEDHAYVAEPAPSLAPDEDLDTYLDAPEMIDDVRLREIVRDVLHEELRGQLGDRITRNVRRLVRREIHRALTQQDYD